MALRGQRLLASAGATVLALTLIPVTAGADPAPHEDGPYGPRDVVVLDLTDDQGDPTTLVSDAGAGGAQPFRAQSTTVTTGALDVPVFSVAAATWDGLEAPEGRIELRVRSDDGWTEWEELEPDHAEDGDVGGTEPYIVGSGTGVEVRVDSASGSFPTSLALHLIPPDPSADDVRASESDELAALQDVAVASEEPAQSPGSAPEDVGEPSDERDSDIESLKEPEVASATSVLPGAATAPSRPNIISRAGWGADDSRQIWTHPLRAAVVHHTAGSNTYTRAQSAGIVRGIQRYHVGGRGWPDVGYHFLVDKYGQVFEGRRGSLDAPPGQMPEGAHAAGFNAGTMGISVLGNYTSVRAPNIALQRMEEVIAWKFHAAQIDMDTPSGFISPGSAARPSGQNLPRVFAHRDVQATTCPGNNIYARIPAMNARVKDLIGPLGAGNRYFLDNSLEGGVADLEFEYGETDSVILIGDWNGDGKDTFAIRRGDEYRITNSLRDNDPNAVVIKYGRPDDVVLVGDWDGDGKDTFAVRRGDEYFVRNSISGGNADVEFTYGRAEDVVLVGDWNGNRKDTFAVRRGDEYFMRNSMSGGNADVAFKYGRPDDEVLVGDWDADRRDTPSVRRERTYYVQNALRGGPAEREFMYGRDGDHVLVGDWDGDGADSFGVRRH